MSARGSVVVLGLALALASGCRMLGEAGPPALVIEKEQATLRAWLECDECWDGELARTVALGERAVPDLVATLQVGMGPATRALLGRQLAQRYEERSAYGSQHPGAMPMLTLEEFQQHHLANRDALYRTRAAMALGRIRGPAAVEALRGALTVRQRADVEEAIRQALENE